jgi:hypothetical protein
MKLLHEFWEWLESNEVGIEDPRPRLDPTLEQVVVAEAAEEEALGEKEPTPAMELSPGVRLVKGEGIRCLLCAVECTLEHGFWGLSIHDVVALESQPLPWAVVLLHGTPTRGYWFTSDQVRKLAVDTWQPMVPGGSHFEIRAPEDLREATSFHDGRELLRLLGSLRPSASSVP